MQPHEKLKVMRQCKGWTQEQTAEKLKWPINTYSKIEQGKASLKVEKLQQIAAVMGVDAEELINSDEKTVFNFAENCHSSYQNNGYIVLSETQCAHELEKAQMQLEMKDKELAMKDREIENLREIIALLKREQHQ